MPERLIGRTLGKYRVETLLGMGGFAWVYAASDPDLGVSVAVKVLKPQFAGDPAFEERFRREASTAARLRHPNIIKIYTVGAEEGSVFFVMDLYARKLSQQLGVMGTLPESAVLKLGIDIASALGFAHRQGVIHRDIKADNILFDDHGNAIVADFGIARAASSLADTMGTNVILGTPQYFAPEQARGQPADSRSDIYSLGVTLFLAATGQLPFTGEDWYEVATKHIEEPPPSPRQLNPLVSSELEVVILKCLEKNPALRYQSADELFGDMAALARADISQNSYSTIMVSTPVTGRHQLLSARSARGTSWPLTVLAAALPIVASVAAFVGVDAVSNSVGVRSLTPVAAVAQIVANPTDSLSAGLGDSTLTQYGDSNASTSQRAGDRGGATISSRSDKFLLTVSAPPQASISINGAVLGRGTWQSDTLREGHYSVVAQLPVASQCIWGRETTTVHFTAAAPSNVVLRPSACGRLMLIVTKGDAAEVDASFSVTGEGGKVIVDGRVPMTVPVLLPVGTHTLAVTAPYCSKYSASLAISADSTARRSIPLICGN